MKPQPVTPAVARLGALAGLCQYDRAIWLRWAELRGTVLIVPMAEQAGALERLFLPQLQAVIPGLTIRCDRTKRQQAGEAKSSLFKAQPGPRKPYTGRLADEVRQEDLLGE